MEQGDLDYAERRRLYKQVWYQKQQAKKKPGYNELYWEHQLEEYRDPSKKRFVVHKSQTTAYRNEKSREQYQRNPEKVRAKNYRSGFNWALKATTKLSKRDLDRLLQLIDEKLIEI